MAGSRKRLRTHSLKMPLLWLAVVLLSLVLAYLIYVQIIVPGRNSASLQEENLQEVRLNSYPKILQVIEKDYEHLLLTLNCSDNRDSKLHS